MKVALFLALLTCAQAQTVLFSENFDSGVVPDQWVKRFGAVRDSGDGFAWTFNNRASGNDSFSAPIDMSQPGTYLLTFEFRSDAASDHPLLVGLSDSSMQARYYAGSEAAKGPVGLSDTFGGSSDWVQVKVDLTPFLSNYAPSELSGLRIAMESWNSGTVASVPVWVDNISVSYAAPSAIPEVSCSGCIAGLCALIAAWWAKKRIGKKRPTSGLLQLPEGSITPTPGINWGTGFHYRPNDGKMLPGGIEENNQPPAP